MNRLNPSAVLFLAAALVFALATAANLRAESPGCTWSITRQRVTFSNGAVAGAVVGADEPFAGAVVGGTFSGGQQWEVLTRRCAR